MRVFFQATGWRGKGIALTHLPMKGRRGQQIRIAAASGPIKVQDLPWKGRKENP